MIEIKKIIIPKSNINSLIDVNSLNIDKLLQTYGDFSYSYF